MQHSNSWTAGQQLDRPDGELGAAAMPAAGLPTHEPPPLQPRLATSCRHPWVQAARLAQRVGPRGGGWVGRGAGGGPEGDLPEGQQEAAVAAANVKHQGPAWVGKGLGPGWRISWHLQLLPGGQ